MVLDLLIKSLGPALITGFVAVALSLLLSVTRVINLLAGAAMAIGSYFLYYVFNSYYPIGAITGIFVSFIVLGGIGAVFYYLTKKLKIFEKEERLIEEFSVLSSYGLHLFLTGIITLFFTARYTTLNIEPEIQITFGILQEKETLVLLSTIIVVVIIFFIFESSLTSFGLHVRAIIENISIAHTIGLPVQKVIAIVTIISFGLLGIAGTLYTFLYPLHPYYGIYYLVVGFIAAGAAGTGNFLFSFLLGTGVSIFNSLLGLFIPQGFALVLAYVLMLITLILRPEGLKRGLR